MSVKRARTESIKALLAHADPKATESPTAHGSVARYVGKGNVVWHIMWEKLCRQLHNGAFMPLVGLGTWNSKPGEVEAAVSHALASGYHHIDCAHVYGNEKEVGDALTKAFATSTLQRESVFVTSKLWNAYQAPDDVEPACRQTLKDLQLDCLDLYLMHWPVRLQKGHSMPPKPDEVLPVDIKETWQAMEKLVSAGLCKAIGVSNFSEKKIAELLEYAKVRPAVNQVEMHPYLQQNRLLEYCESQGIVVTAYSPLGSPDRPPRTKDEADPVLMEEDLLKELGDKYGVSAAQVLIAWSVARGVVVIPKSITPSRIESNLQSGEISLERADMAKLNLLDRHLRLLKGKLWVTDNGPYKTLADLWDE